MRLELGTFLFLASILVPACTSVEQTPQNPELAAACEQLLEARTAYDQRCDGIFAVAPSAAEHRGFVDSCVGIAAAPGSRLTATDVKACAAALDTCAPGGAYPSCLGTGAGLLHPGHDRTGSRAPGEACFAGVQCDSGYCGGDDSACGACQRVRHAGETCTDADDRCVDGTCHEGTCQIPGKKEGEACIDYGGGDCGETLYCKTASGIDGTCAPRGAAGDACEPGTPCLSGLTCAAGACAPLFPDGASCAWQEQCASHDCGDGVCTTRPWGLAEGMDCSKGYCRADLICGDDHVCAKRAYGQTGADCTVFDYPGKPCAPGLYCHTCFGSPNCPLPLKGDCRPLPGPGEPCGALAECAVGTTCEGHEGGGGMNGICVRLGGEGDPCPCVDALVCVDGTCKAAGAALCE